MPKNLINSAITDKVSPVKRKTGVNKCDFFVQIDGLTLYC
jgi:hypothetical protein